MTHVALVFHPTSNCVPFFLESDSQVSATRDAKGSWFSQGLIDFVSRLRSHNVTLDLIACSLGSLDFKEDVKSFEARTGGTVRYSTSPIGNVSNWYLDSHGISVRDLYFNERIALWDHVLINFPSSNSFSNLGPTYELLYDDQGQPTGQAQRCHSIVNIEGQPVNPLYDTDGKNIRNARSAVVAWGAAGNLVNYATVQPQLTGVVSVVCTDFSSAALLHGGTVVTWGSAIYGGKRGRGLQHARRLRGAQI